MDSLYTDRPVLKNPSEGDLDPLAKAEIDRQKPTVGVNLPAGIKQPVSGGSRLG
jgi:hypothetical protein